MAAMSADQPPETRGACGSGSERSDASEKLLHATAVAINGHAVLLRGPVGAGKSDLALRLLAFDAAAHFVTADVRLICDDYVRLDRAVAGGRPGSDLIVTPGSPDIAGLIEVRGVGLFRVDTVASAPVRLLVDLVPTGALIERLPLPLPRERLLGVEIERIALQPFESSAALKVVLAVIGNRISDC